MCILLRTDLISRHTIIEDEQEARQAEPVGLLRAGHVLQPSVEGGDNGTAEHGHDEQRRTGLGELAQVGHGQRPQGRPHQRAAQRHERDEVDGDVLWREHDEQRTDDSQNGAYFQRSGLADVFRNEDDAADVADDDADGGNPGVVGRTWQAQRVGIIDECSKRNGFNAHVEEQGETAQQQVGELEDGRLAGSVTRCAGNGVVLVFAFSLHFGQGSEECHDAQGDEGANDDDEGFVQVFNADEVHVFAQQPHDEDGRNGPSQLVADTHDADALGGTLQRTQDGDVGVDGGLQVGVSRTADERSQQEEAEALVVGREDEQVEGYGKDDERERHGALVADGLDGESGRVAENKEGDERRGDNQIRSGVRDAQRTLQDGYEQ